MIKLFFIIAFTFIFISNFPHRIGRCNEEKIEALSEELNWFLYPVEDCTGGISIDKFLDEFHLEKANKIIIKKRLRKKDTGKSKIITKLIDSEEIALILAAMKKAQCLEFPIVPKDVSTEFWVYENDELLLKIAFLVGKRIMLFSYYRADHVPYENAPLGGGKGLFIIHDEKICSWVYGLKNETNVK